jgi:hypothetical protein
MRPRLWTGFLPLGFVLLAGIASGCAPSGATAAPGTAPVPAATVVPAASAVPSASPKPAVAVPSASARPAASAVPYASPAAGASVAPSAVPASNVAAPKPANASLSIVQPAAGGTISSGSVTVVVNYTGPTLVPAASATALDQYHLHYLLDVDPAPYIGTTTPMPLNDPRIIHTASTQVTFDNVAPGPHRVSVIMSGANHVSVDPPVSQQITFTAS